MTGAVSKREATPLDVRELSGDGAPLGPPQQETIPHTKETTTPAQGVTVTGKKRRSSGRKRGNANALRRYWAYGRGAGKVAWNTPGDFTRCVAQVSRYMSKRQAKGFCANSHKRATGQWPGQHGGRKRGKATR